ncbi:hypothetical protein ACFWCB_32105 [Streptomyces sp. NPDC060048]|uniref:hypothetical protein n=1 Tax=unclassified Streptomyces TaxID=2593676 RepID=UPI0036AFD54F
MSGSDDLYGHAWTVQSLRRFRSHALDRDDDPRATPGRDRLPVLAVGVGVGVTGEFLPKLAVNLEPLVRSASVEQICTP